MSAVWPSELSEKGVSGVHPHSYSRGWIAKLRTKESTSPICRPRWGSVIPFCWNATSSFQVNRNVRVVTVDYQLGLRLTNQSQLFGATTPHRQKREKAVGVSLYEERDGLREDAVGL